MTVYLDSSATTIPYKEVCDTVCETMLNTYANPSSLHNLGKDAEDLMENARKYISGTINGTPNEIYFTSGGTESDNIAILGYARANKREGLRVITQKTEHMAVLESFSELEKEGFEVIYVDVDSFGMPDINQIKNSVNDNTILLSFMHVNNENGAIFPIDEISSLIDHKKCVLHVDAVQSYGKMKIDVKKSKIDMLSLSAHKIHGPNGVGALYVKKGLKINPVIFGGKQEGALRSGTQNVAGIYGFMTASKIKHENMKLDEEKVLSLKNRLLNGIGKEIENVYVNSSIQSSPYILNVSFPPIRSEILLHVLESNGIYISTGSACSSKKNSKSYVLKSMALKDNIIDSAIRFSFSSLNTKEEIDYTLDVLKKEIPKLRKIIR